MNKKKQWIYIVFGFIILTEIIYFNDYLIPIQWGQLKVSGQACTCPDNKVVNGSLYLRSITPDSLKQYDIDYSEIYVTSEPNNYYNQEIYLIKGKVIGKERVSKTDPWNLVLEVDTWRYLPMGNVLLTKLLILITVLLLPISLRKFNK